MTATTLAQAAYGRDARAIQTPRGIECDAFSRITSKLHFAAQGSGGTKALAEAIHNNRRLWFTLAADVADSDNALPANLRAQIMYLAEFTDTYSSQVLSGEASAEPLVDINTSIMRGLRRGRAAA